MKTCVFSVVRGSTTNSPSDKDGEGSQVDLTDSGGDDNINVVVRLVFKQATLSSDNIHNIEVLLLFHKHYYMSMCTHCVIYQRICFHATLSKTVVRKIFYHILNIWKQVFVYIVLLFFVGLDPSAKMKSTKRIRRPCNFLVMEGCW